MYGYYAYPKPSVHGFPTVADPADRSCRYLVQPPTVPSLTRLRGYQRPPRGGRSRCRRACERTPLRGRRRRALPRIRVIRGLLIYASTSPSSSVSSATPNSTPSRAKSAGHSAPPFPRCVFSHAQPSTVPYPTSDTASPPSKLTQHNLQSFTFTES
jgi:hypothetical protein